MRIPFYPETRYAPATPPDLGSKVERERLSAPALKGFFNIMAHWQVRDEDARQLLGGVTNGPYYQIKQDPAGRVLDTHGLLKIFSIPGIFLALNTPHTHAL